MSSDSPQRPADTLPGHAAARPSLDQHMANSDVPEPAPTPHTGGAVPSFMASLLPQVSTVDESPGQVSSHSGQSCAPASMRHKTQDSLSTVCQEFVHKLNGVCSCEAMQVL